MWRCQTCKNVVPPGMVLTKFCTYREVPITRIVAGEVETGTRKEIANEYNVCKTCLERLKGGSTIQEIYGVATSPPPEEAKVEVEIPPVMEVKKKDRTKVVIIPSLPLTDGSKRVKRVTKKE